MHGPKSFFAFGVFILIGGLTTKIIVLVLVVILAEAYISVSMGMTNSDKDAINSTVVQALEKTGDFSYINAGVDSSNNLTIWSTFKSIDHDSTINNVGYIIGAYLGTAKDYPDLSDLNILIDTNENVTEKMYCKRAWVDEVKVDPTGNVNDNDLAVLVLKVLDTLQMTSK